MPTRNFARFSLMLFIIYCLIMRTVYQGGIYNILKSNDGKPDVATIDELVVKGYTFYIYETLAQRVKDFKFYEHSIVFPNIEIDKYRRKALEPSSKAAVFNYLDQILYSNELNYKNFTYHICKERFTTNQFVFYFRKNHYMVEGINSLLVMLLKAGVPQFINSQYANTKFLKQDSSNGQVKLSLQHFKGAFELLLIMNTLAVAVFVLELMLSLKKIRRLCSI